MKQSHIIVILVGFITIITFVNNVYVYYHPSMGRFLQRDPGANDVDPSHVLL